MSEVLLENEDNRSLMVSSVKAWQVTIECKDCEARFDDRVYSDPIHKKYYTICPHCDVVVVFGGFGEAAEGGTTT
jgi:hypothetical protein